MREPRPLPSMDLARKARIIGYALLGGQAVFACLVGWLTRGGKTEEWGFQEVPFLTLLGPGFALLALVAAFLLRKRLWIRFREGGRERREMLYLSSYILPMAILEGACLLNLVAWLLNPGTFSPGLAAALVFGAGFLFLPREAFPA